MHGTLPIVLCSVALPLLQSGLYVHDVAFATSWALPKQLCRQLAKRPGGSKRKKSIAAAQSNIDNKGGVYGKGWTKIGLGLGNMEK